MAKKGKLGPVKADPEKVVEPEVVEFENPGTEISAGGYSFEFIILNDKNVELERIWVNADGGTEAEALSRAADSITGKWSYTGNFRKALVI